MRAFGLLATFGLVLVTAAFADPSPTPTLQPLFSVIKPSILDVNCTTCHNDANVAKGMAGKISFESYASLMKTPTILSMTTAGDPTTSVLIIAVTGSDAKKIMPMPYSTTADPLAPISADDIQTLSAWIQNGAQND